MLHSPSVRVRRKRKRRRVEVAVEVGDAEAEALPKIPRALAERLVVSFNARSRAELLYLSNHGPVPVRLQKRWYPTGEAAFQSLKYQSALGGAVATAATDVARQTALRRAAHLIGATPTPHVAKFLGSRTGPLPLQAHELRHWEEGGGSLRAQAWICEAKVREFPDLARALLASTPGDGWATLALARSLVKLGDLPSATALLVRLEVDARDSLAGAEAQLGRFAIANADEAEIVDATLRSAETAAVADLEAVVVRARRLADVHALWTAYLAAGIALRRLGRHEAARGDLTEDPNRMTQGLEVRAGVRRAEGGRRAGGSVAEWVTRLARHVQASARTHALPCTPPPPPPPFRPPPCTRRCRRSRARQWAGF